MAVICHTPQALAQSIKSLRVGVVLALSGDAALNAGAMRKGIEFAADELRTKGWQVDLDFQDDETNPGKTVSSYQYLLARGYRTFIGPTWSYQVNAVKPSVAQSGAVTIVPAGSSDTNGGASAGVFNLCPQRRTQVPVLHRWLGSVPYKRAFIMTPLGDWGLVHQELYRESLKGSGLEVVGDQDFSYGADMAELKALLLKAKAAHTDLILSTAGAKDFAQLFKARAELKMDTALVVTENFWDAMDLDLIPKDEAALAKVFVLGFPARPAFVESFRQRYGAAPQAYADRGYDAVMLLAQAVSSTGGNATAMREALTHMDTYQGVSGPIQFNAEGDRISSDYRIIPALERGAILAD